MDLNDFNSSILSRNSSDDLSEVLDDEEYFAYYNSSLVNIKSNLDEIAKKYLNNLGSEFLKYSPNDIFWALLDRFTNQFKSQIEYNISVFSNGIKINVI